MSEHTWVLENLAGYVAGGLDAEEREQLKEHLDECADCARTFAEVRAADRKLDGLFADVRPNPAMEDRSIQMLRRQTRRPGAFFLSRRGKVLVAAAAVVFVAFTGAGLGALIDEDQIQFPGSAENHLKQIALGVHMVSGTVTELDGVAPLTRSVRTDGEWREFALKDADAMAEEIRQQAEHFATDESKHTSTLPGHLSVRQRGFQQLGDQLKGKEAQNTPTDGLSNTFGFSPDGRTLAARSGASGLGARNNDLAPFSGNGVATYTPQKVIIHNSSTQTTAKNEPDRKFVGDFEPGKLNLGQSFPPPSQQGKEDPKGNNQTTLKPDRVNQVVTFGDKAEKKPEQPPEKAPPVARRVIRSGDIDFEVNSFDDAVAVVTRLVNATKGGYIATINSDKLPNGKVKGSVVVRVPPDQLDRLVLDLRKEIGKAGELKGQKIGSQDITKQYTDLESRLRAARTMEERLLKIIRDGKGEIKDLVAAEKELGVWRTRVEEIEGELRYYNNLVSLSTLTVNLTEKDIREAAAIDERERVQAGIEVEDVDQSYREALKAVTEAKGRITKSELKQQSAGQFSAVLHFEVEPEKAGPVRDRLKQLGNMVRLEIDRVQTAQGGGTAPRDGKVKRGPTQFFISLYNLASVTPRETQTLRLAAPDVPTAFGKLRDALTKVKGRVLNAQLNEQDRQNVTAQLDFDIRRADEGTIQNSLSGAGETLSRHVGRAAESENVTDAKVRFKVELVQATAIPPREIVTLAVEVADVKAALAVLNAQVKEVEGRTVDSQIGQERNGRVTARVIVDVPLTAEAGLTAKVESAGAVRVQRVTRNPQAPESKFAMARLDVTLSNEVLLPRDEGLWAQVRNGLSFSLRGLSLSVSWLIVGVLFLLPWAILVYAVVWLFRRSWRAEPAPAATTAMPTGSGTPPDTGT
jgi:hypothetical protein